MNHFIFEFEQRVKEETKTQQVYFTTPVEHLTRKEMHQAFEGFFKCPYKNNPKNWQYINHYAITSTEYFIQLQEDYDTGNETTEISHTQELQL